MKKKLLVITIVLAMLAALSACGPKIPTPTETADTFLTAVKAQDNESLAAVYAGDGLDLLEKAAEADESEIADEDSGLTRIYEEQMIPRMLDFDYELSNEQIDGDKATVDVKFTAYNIGDAFTAFFSDYLSQALMLAFSDPSEEDLDALAATVLSGKLADLTEKTYETTATLSLSMQDGKWVVDEIRTGDEIVDGLTGGLMTAFANMEDAFSAWED